MKSYISCQRRLEDFYKKLKKEYTIEQIASGNFFINEKNYSVTSKLYEDNYAAISSFKARYYMSHPEVDCEYANRQSFIVKAYFSDLAKRGV